MSEAIESSWEQYEEYMVATGQWLTEHDYASMIESMYQSGYAYEDFLSYEDATHGF